MLPKKRRVNPAKPKQLGIDVTNGNFIARLRVKSRRKNAGEGTASFSLSGTVNDSKVKMSLETGNCNWESYEGRHSKFKLAIIEEGGVYKYKLFRKNPDLESSFHRISKGTITPGAQGSSNVSQPAGCAH